MSFDKTIATSVSNFLIHPQQKVLLLKGEISAQFIGELDSAVRKQTPSTLLIDASRTDVDSKINNVSFHEPATFIFTNASLENIYLKYKLDRWQAKVIIACDNSLLHPTLDPSIYFAPFKGTRIQRHLFTQLNLPSAIKTIPAMIEYKMPSTIVEQPSQQPSIYDHFLNQKLMVNDPVMMQMFADRVLLDENFKTFVFQLLYASRESDRVTIGAANAITLLKYAVPFSGMDLSRLKVKRANLSGAIFDHTDLSNTDLSYCNFEKALFRAADLSNATLADVSLGLRQVPQLKAPTRFLSYRKVTNKIYLAERQLLAMNCESSIDIFSLAENCLIWQLVPKEIQKIERFCLAPNGEWLVIAGEGKKSHRSVVECWNIATKNIVKSLSFKNNENLANFGEPLIVDQNSVYFAMVVSVEGALGFATQYQLRIYDAMNYSLQKTITLNSGEDYVCFHRDNQFLLIARHFDNVTTIDQKIYTQIDVVAMQSPHNKVQTIQMQNTNIILFALSPQGNFLVTASEAKQLQLWKKDETENYQLLNSITLGAVPSAIMINRQQTLFALAVGNDIYLYQLETGQLLYQWSAHQGAIETFTFDLSGKRLASGGNDNAIHVWSIDQREPVQSFAHQSGIDYLCFMEKQNELLAIDAAGTNYIWNINPAQNAVPYLDHKTAIAASAIDKQRKCLITVDFEGQIYLRNKINGRIVKASRLPCALNKNSVVALLEGGRQLVNIVAKQWKNWNTDTGTLMAEGFFDEQPIANGASSDLNSLWVLTSSQLYLFHQEVVCSTQPQLFSMINSKENITAITSDAAHTFIAVGTEWGRVRLFDCRTGKLVKELRPSNKNILKLSLSPNGRYIAYAVKDDCSKSICVLELHTGKQVFNHSYSHEVMVWNDSSNRLIIGGAVPIGSGVRPSVSYWNTTENDTIIKEISPVWFYATTFQFLSDDTLLIGDDHGEIKVWTYKEAPIYKEWCLDWRSRATSFDASYCHLTGVIGLSSENAGILSSNPFNTPTTLPWLPIHLAAAKDDLKAVSGFLERDASAINTLGEHNDTPLHVAAVKASLQVLQFLIANGADLNAKGRQQRTPLHHAVYFHQLTAVKILLQASNIDEVAQDEDGATALHLACAQGDEGIALLIISSSKNKKKLLAVCNAQGETPLALAAVNGHVSLVAALIKLGADVNVTAKYNYALLHIAVMGGIADVVRIILAHVSVVDVKDDGQYTPLHIAAKSSSNEILQLLLDADAAIEARNENNHTPLHIAASAGQENSVAYLLQRGAAMKAKDSLGKTAVEMAIKQGHRLVVMFLLENRDYVNVTNQEAVSFFEAYYDAQSKREMAIYQLLVAKQFDKKLTQKQWQAEMVRLMNSGQLEALECLLKSNLQPSWITIQSIWSLFLDDFLKHQRYDATEREALRVKTFLLLVKYGFDIYQRHDSFEQQNALERIFFSGEFPLLVSALIAQHRSINVQLPDIFRRARYFSEKEKALDFLKAQGLVFNVNAVNQAKQTSLHIAAANDDINGANWLLDSGAQVDAKDNQNRAPLHIAALHLKPAVASVLIAHGASCEALDATGLSPLFILLSQINTLNEDISTTVQALLSNGCSVTSRNKEGLTSLQFLIKMASQTQYRLMNDSNLAKRYGAVVSCLLKQGENKETTYDGLTIFLMAVKMGSEALVSYLIRENFDHRARTGASYFYGAGLTAIQVAALQRTPHIVTLLKRHGHDIDEHDVNGWPLTHRVARSTMLDAHQKFEFIEFFFQQGAKVTAEDKDKNTLLDAAVLFGNFMHFGFILNSMRQRDRNLKTENATKLAVQNCMDLMQILLADHEQKISLIEDAVKIVETLDPNNLTVPLALARFYLIVSIMNVRKGVDYAYEAQKVYMQLLFGNNQNLKRIDVYVEYAFFAYQTKRPYDVSNAQNAIDCDDNKTVIVYTEKDRPLLNAELQAELDFCKKLEINMRAFAYYIVIKNYKQHYTMPDQITTQLAIFAKFAQQLKEPLVYLLLGHAYKEHEKYREALAAYGEAIKLYRPNTAHAEYMTAKACGEELRIKHAEKLTPLPAPTYESLIASARQKYFMMQYLAAIEDLNQAIQLRPDELLTYQMRSETRQAIPDKQSLTRHINVAISENPADAFNYYDLGNAYHDLMRLNEALDCYNRAIDRNPRIAAFYQNRGDVKGCLFHFDACMQDLYQAIALGGGNAVVYNNLGYYKNAMGQYAEAIPHLLQAKELMTHLLPIYKNLCIAYAMQGQFALAIEQAKAGLSFAQFPVQKAVILSVIAIAQCRAGNFHEAQAKISEAMTLFPLQQDPTYFEFCLIRAEISIQQSQFKRACEDLRAIPKEQWGTLARALYGYALYKMSDPQASLYYKLSLSDERQKYPDLCCVWRAKSQLHCGNQQDAFADFAQALKINPFGTYIYVERASAASDIGNHEQALADYTKLCSLDANNAVWKQGLLDMQAKIKLIVAPPTMAHTTLFTTANDMPILNHIQRKNLVDTLLFGADVSTVTVTQAERTLVITYIDDVGLDLKPEILALHLSGVSQIKKVSVQGAKLLIETTSVKEVKALYDLIISDFAAINPAQNAASAVAAPAKK